MIRMATSKPVLTSAETADHAIHKELKMRQPGKTGIDLVARIELTPCHGKATAARLNERQESSV